MGRGYDCPMMAIAKVYFLTILVVQNVHASPRRVHRDGRESDNLPLSHENTSSGNISQLSSQSGNDSHRNQTQDELTRLIQRAFQNGDLISPEGWSKNKHREFNRTVQRDTSRYQGTYTTRGQNRAGKSQPEERRLFGDNEGSSTVQMSQSDGKIVFPTDDDMTSHGDKFDARPVPVCRGSTFCERANFYPETLVNEAIHRNDSLKYLAGVDVVSDIIQRIDVTDDVPLCVSTEQVVYPKSAENKRKEWLFVVNQDNFKQGVRIETCSNENGDCSVIDGLAEGYKTTCRQKYIYRQLAAVTDGNVVPEMFKFPSSCCCHVKFTGNPLTRMGVRVERYSRK